MKISADRYPTEEELKSRIERHRGLHVPTRNFGALWRGYLSALVDWGLIEVAVYDRVVTLIPNDGADEQIELFGEIPFSPNKEWRKEWMKKMGH